MELFAIVFLFGFVCAGDYIYNDDLSRIDSIKPEHGCSSAGGMCVIAADCPEGLLASKSGLCPQQQRQGVECCYGISVKETRCTQLGGECFSQQFCKPKLRNKEARNCPQDSVCCMLF